MSASYRYLLDVEIDGSERGHLIDALEDEPFELRNILGEAQMNAQLKEGRLLYDGDATERQPWFGEVIEVLSVYISSYIYGLEMAETRVDGKRTVELLKHIGRRGERIAVPLTHTIEFPSGEITPGDEDLDYLEANWAKLPRWAQDGFRIKYPVLRRL